MSYVMDRLKKSGKVKDSGKPPTFVPEVNKLPPQVTWVTIAGGVLVGNLATLIVVYILMMTILEGLSKR